MNYLRTLTYRMDRSERADPLIRETVMNNKRYGRLDSSGYGRLARPQHDGSLTFDSSTQLNSAPYNRPFSTQANPKILEQNSNNKDYEEKFATVHSSTLEPITYVKHGRRGRKKKQGGSIATRRFVNSIDDHPAAISALIVDPSFTQRKSTGC